MPEVALSSEDLERTRRRHLREIRIIEKMTDAQFDAFRRNFSLGVCDPRISRQEAIQVLRSMIMTNLSLQREKERQAG
jgi:hypothetical protein